MPGTWVTSVRCQLTGLHTGHGTRDKPNRTRHKAQNKHKVTNNSWQQSEASIRRRLFGVCVRVCVCVPYNFSCSSNLLFSCEREEEGKRGGWSKQGGLGACQRGRVRQLATKSSLNWKFCLTKAAPRGEGGWQEGVEKRRKQERRGGSREERGTLRHDNCSMRAVCALCKLPSLVELLV